MDITSLLTRLTLEEKLTLLTGHDAWATEPVDRLGIPAIRVSDGPHGLRFEQAVPDGTVRTLPSTCFPTASALAATWDPSLAREVGAALADEAAVLGVDVLLGPAINIKRTPLCGRNFEYFSEDPLLTGQLAAAYIAGVQGRGVGTSLKHYAANNQECDRSSVSVEADERTMREIYLRAFEIAVRAAQPWTVMCSYNRVGGVYASENAFLLDRVLRRELGFQGIVVSDWGAVHDRARALKASLELEMPHAAGSLSRLKEAYAAREITDAEIDRAVGSLLRLVDRALGGRATRARSFDAAAHHALAGQVARRAVTLLKNEAGLLPIDGSRVKSMSVIGVLAKEPFIQGGGSSRTNPANVEGALEAMKAHAGRQKIALNYLPTYMQWAAFPSLDGLHESVVAASRSDLAVLFVGTGERIESESFDRPDIRLAPDFERLILTVAEKNPATVVVVQAGSAIDMSAWIGKVRAVVFAWFSGQAGGPAVADVLFGAVNPSGRIAETFPLRLEDTPSFGTYPGNGGCTWYREGPLVGYRWYDTIGKEVLFPFGHGLSYTSFEYADLRIEKPEAAGTDEIAVTFTVRNTGGRAGIETAQLYVQEIAPRVLRPARELRGFATVDLASGKSADVRLSLGPDAFSYWNSSLGAWHVQAGDARILVGSSSRDIRLERRIRVSSPTELS
jgi:beta-glucosidase